jgi:hypothetical protein
VGGRVLYPSRAEVTVSPLRSWRATSLDCSSVGDRLDAAYNSTDRPVETYRGHARHQGGGATTQSERYARAHCLGTGPHDLPIRTPDGDRRPEGEARGVYREACPVANLTIALAAHNQAAAGFTIGTTNSVTAMAAKTATALSATTVMTATIPAGLRRRQHSGKVVAVS